MSIIAAVRTADFCEFRRSEQGTKQDSKTLRQSRLLQTQDAFD